VRTLADVDAPTVAPSAPGRAVRILDFTGGDLRRVWGDPAPRARAGVLR
jgi:hypothetical protein